MLSPLADTRATAPALERRLVTTDVEDGVARLRVRRERAGQMLNPATIFQLHQAVAEAEADPSVRGVVITGEGGAFANGADVRWFYSAITDGDIDHVVVFTAAAAACFDAIERCGKPVVAALNGSALGGGLELALACRTRVATRGASLALPETGLGIFPACGGIHRTARLLGPGAAKWLVYTGKTLGGPAALSLGLVDALVEPDELLGVASDAARTGALPTIGQVTPTQATGDASVLPSAFATRSIDQWLAPDQADVPELTRARRSLAARAPIALRIAERLFDEAQRLPAAERDRSCLLRVAEAFRTRDAEIGLKAVVSGLVGRPRFTGS